LELEFKVIKKFKVSVYREWLERGTVGVVTADSDEAMQFARELLDMDDPDFFGRAKTWI
jgi:hypothetical protein